MTDFHVTFRGVPLIPPIECSDPESWIAERIYEMGADQELEACCQWLQVRINEGWNACHLEELRAARRPKPPSLKEQAFAALEEEPEDDKELIVLDTDQVNIIRRALEQVDG